MRKIVIAATGASGAIYTKLLLDKFRLIQDQWNEINLVFSDNAREIARTEVEGFDIAQYPWKNFDKTDFNAPFASGSGQFDTMIIIPCSMGTLARIANGISNDLITRAADVILKERRKLICVVRETPYSLIHIRNMEAVTLAGGIVCPATPSFYSKPTTIEALAQTVVDRVLDLCGFDHSTYRWGQNR